MPRRRFFSKGASRGHLAAAQPPQFASPPKSRLAARPSSQRRRSYDYAVYEREPATPEYLCRLFAAHDFPLTAEQARSFWLFYDLLRRRNAALGLTRIMGIEATVLKHFVDSLMPLRLWDIRGPLLDIGSGAGFPGVPLAIFRPEMRIILAESRGKRAAFLEELKRDLALANVIVYPRSVREDSPFCPAEEGESGEESSQRLTVRDVICRALETISSTLCRVRKFLPSGGRAIFLKGPNCGREITAAQAAWKGIFKMAADIHYVLPHSRNQRRRLVVFERR
ncbi:MAG: 16S rRNA (guanine(527)-N(7))-methyltransferase RsmG [Planctomycetota bacterium]|nr:16S rRNA (guanine(527)-N(7))-methyltransferase RsmG [Planctomycetota bacterium]